MKARTALLLLTALVASACQIRFDTNVVVNADGSGTFALEISLDEEFRQLSEDNGGGELDLTEGLGDDPPAGWSVEEFTDGEFEGVRIVTDFDILDQLDQRLGVLQEASEDSADGSPTDMFTGLSITDDGGAFRFSTTLSGLEEGITGGDAFEGFDPSELFDSLFVIRLLVTLPGTPGDHNADELDGNTFVWSIGLTDEGLELFATSQAGGGGLNPLAIVLLVVAAAAAVFFVLARREDDAVGSVVDAGPAGGVEVGADPFAEGTSEA